MTANPEFKEAVEIGKMNSLYFYETQLIQHATGAIRGNTASLIFTLINRFPDLYKNNRDKIEEQKDITIKLKYDPRKKDEE